VYLAGRRGKQAAKGQATDGRGEETVAGSPYLLGIDLGTESVRAGLFDPEGTPAAFHAVEVATHHPRPGWAEQDPGQWWSSLVGAVKGAMEAAGAAPGEVAAISVDATSSTVLAVDEDGEHLRPAIMWMDVRAADQARRVQETGDPALKYNGFGPVSAEWGLPKALWLKEREPETWRAARHVCDCGDWVIQRLTGEWAASINFASSKYYYDRDEGGFPERLYQAVGIEDLLDRYPRDVTDLGVGVGGLRPEVASELSLRPGTLVAQGGIDAYLGALGLGVVEPGTLALITGSSHVMIGQAAEPIHDQGFWGAYTDAMIPGQYTIEAGQAATGSVVAWFRNRLAGEAVAEAERRGVDPYEVLTERARQVPAGSDGLVVLDYFQGNRTPHTDPLTRGMVWGLSLSHGPGHVFRAILEGICYGTEDILRTFRNADFEPRSVIASGGPTKSDLWMQMHADVSNVPISFTRHSEGPALGAAMLAAVGAEIYPDVPTAAEHMVHVERTIEPDKARHEEYRFFMDKYVETYPRMKDLMHGMVRHHEQRAHRDGAA
jgi:FGGY-family pentulose kinase